MFVGHVADRRRVDEAQQAFVLVGAERRIAAVLCADIHRAATGQLVLLEDLVELQRVVVVKKDVVPDERKALRFGIHRPRNG